MASAKARVRKLNKLLKLKGLPYNVRECLEVMKTEAEKQANTYTYKDVFMEDWYEHSKA